MFLPHFSTEQHLHLAVGAILILLAIVLHGKGREVAAVGFLTLGALALRLFAIQLDPYLSFWDEVYHAAVARNMVASPFTPMLYTVEAMPTSEHWTNSNIWLHKPPFFLWQMAASIGLFGAEPWAVRLPSALWTAALVPVTYRMAELITRSRTTAFLSAAVTACAYYYQEIVSGALNTDHNDAIFISLVAFSWWAWLEHLHRNSLGWTLLTGLFSGAAVLTKWYMGAIIFLPWTILLAVRRMEEYRWRDMLVAAGICAALAGAWILHMIMRFPQQALHEWRFKAAHLGTAMDVHEGTWSYHLDIIQKLFPPWSSFVVGLALVLLVLKANAQHRIFIITLVAATHLLFGIAATKMPSNTLILLPLYIIALAHVVSRLVSFLASHYRTVGFALATAWLAFAMLGIERTQRRHTLAIPELIEQDPRRKQLAMLEAQNMLVTMLIDPQEQVVFNMPAPHSIQFMFRTGFNTMAGVPTQAQVDKLIRSGFDVVVLQDTMPLEAMPSGVTLIPVELPR